MSALQHPALVLFSCWLSSNALFVTNLPAYLCPAAHIETDMDGGVERVALDNLDVTKTIILTFFHSCLSSHLSLGLL